MSKIAAIALIVALAGCSGKKTPPAESAAVPPPISYEKTGNPLPYAVMEFRLYYKVPAGWKEDVYSGKWGMHWHHSGLDAFVRAQVVWTHGIDAEELLHSVQQQSMSKCDWAKEGTGRETLLFTTDDKRSAWKDRPRGIGIHVGVLSKELVILDTVPGSPAANAGIKPDDRIIQVDGVKIADVTVDQAASLIRGRWGSEVNLLVNRPGTKTPLTFKVTRQLPVLGLADDRGGVSYIDVAEGVGNRAGKMAILRLDSKGWPGLSVIAVGDWPKGNDREALAAFDSLLSGITVKMEGGPPDPSRPSGLPAEKPE